MRWPAITDSTIRVIRAIRGIRVIQIVALLVLTTGIVDAQTRVWQVDVGGTALAEAWDFNETKESLIGIKVGADRRVWKTVAIRAEGSLLQVKQPGPDAWSRGLTVGARSRWAGARLHRLVDIAVGISHATSRVPSRGTQRNYLLLAGGGVAIPIRPAPSNVEGPSMTLDLVARWFHMSNNGLEGRHLNPDIQALGVVVAIGWGH